MMQACVRYKENNVLEGANNVFSRYMDAVHQTLKLSEGKFTGKTVDEIMQIDPTYVWFLSQRHLTHVQLLKYKKFFDSCPDVITRAKEMTQGLEMPTVRQHQIHTPGGWRGW